MTRSRTAALLVLLAALLAGARAARGAPAAALVMPFDASAGSVSFLVASHPRSDALPSGVHTHWTFWGDDCTPLLDVVRCLPPDGTLVLDPTSLSGTGADGGVLAGRRGFATVVAYAADDVCDATDRVAGDLAGAALLGSFTLADLASGASFGGAAVGLAADAGTTFVDVGAPGGAGDLRQADLRLQSFAPSTLGVSRVILLALAERAGDGALRRVEPGPAVAGDARVQAALRFVTGDGTSVALRDTALGCATFSSLRSGDQPTLLVPVDDTAIASGGMLVLDEPRIGDRALGTTSVLLGFHAQAVGSFGVLAVGDAALVAATQPSPGPSPTAGTATPTVRPSASVSPRPSDSAVTPTPRPTVTSPPTPRPSASVVAPTQRPTATSQPTPRPSTTTGATPTPRPSGTAGATPTPRPIATPTPRATSTVTQPTPSVSTTPSRTASPRPSVVPTATPAPTATSGATATPRPTGTVFPSPGACSTLTLAVRTAYGAGDVSGVLATVSYPAAVSIPGTGSDGAVLARVSNVSGTSGLFNATDTDSTIRVGLVSVSSAIPAGAFVRITFDCVASSVPAPGSFGCALEASTLDGTLVPGATCTTEILS